MKSNIDDNDIERQFSDILERRNEFFKGMFLEAMQNRVSGFEMDEKVHPLLINELIIPYIVESKFGLFNTYKNIEDSFEFYIVGNQIPIKDENGCCKMRDAIPANELVQSFPVNARVKLFFFKDDAINYSRATRSGNIECEEQCYQSPVIKVKPVIHLDLKDVKAGMIYINESIKKSRNHILYFEISTKDLVPSSVQLINEHSAECNNTLECST